MSSAPQAKHVSIAAAAIAASIWTGLWGYFWAVAHLRPNQIYTTSLIGLGVGAGLTVVLIVLTVWILYRSVRMGGDGETGTAQR
jgi:hypothetical protein